MKKNDLFTFTAPNGAEVQAVVLSTLDNAYYVQQEQEWRNQKKILAYAQNRIVLLDDKRIYMNGRYYGNIIQDRIIVDYAILPGYDELLARYNDIEVAQAETQSGM